MQLLLRNPSFLAAQTFDGVPYSEVPGSDLTGKYREECLRVTLEEITLVESILKPLPGDDAYDLEVPVPCWGSAREYLEDRLRLLQEERLKYSA